MGEVCNLFSDKHKLPEIVKVSTLDVLCYFLIDRKLNNIENSDQTLWLINVVHNDGIIIEDTEKYIE